MQRSINERLSHVDEDFLLAAAQGESSLTAFRDRWFDIFLDLENAVPIKNIEEEVTTTFLKTIAPRVAVLTDHLMEFKTSADAMQSDLDGIFARFDLNDEHATPLVRNDPPSRPNAIPTTQHLAQPSSSPPYIEPAYRWLLQNIHNPYPAKATREEICRQHSYLRKAVDTWFIEARKRMGWNALRRSRFANKRVDIVDAATRFFVQPDDKRPLDPNIELEFASIERRAKDLYSDRFSQSILATKLDVTVKDLTPQMKAQAQADERRRRQEIQERHVLAASSYPSPERSPTQTPEPVTPSPPVEYDGILSTESAAISRTKRPRYSTPDETIGENPSKRHRSDAPSPHTTTPSTGLPSPAPSSDEPSFTSSSSQDISIPIPAPPSSNRKRRLSESDGSVAPNRPRNLVIGPRMHAVSDPLPVASTLFEASRLDNWFSENFGIPDTFHADELDDSQHLDVEVFDFSTFDTHTSSATPESLNAVHYYSPHTLQDESVSALVDQALYSESALEVSTNTFDYNELFWGPSPEAALPDQSSISWYQDPSLLMSQNTSLENHHPSPDAILFPPLDILSPTFDPSTSHFDWGLIAPIMPQEAPADQLHSFEQPFVTQVPFDMFNMLNSTSSCVSQLLSQTDKAAKQRKLLEMKEAARRLEEEIAAS
ncbi:Mating-type protein beta1-1 [Hypsizygus marmoreus]|uniref:Mating-type protein HD1.3 n=1 Tax=Hypsizygus marmoreus TaxID=39966 RepID=A0A369K9X7_HYPMA|nr:mating-type protein HD1.3 [Hypsizygus marmoreus]RDB29475.1 Mating-type protein beta1-1 [Hypsizygus marmoreus]